MKQNNAEMSLKTAVSTLVNAGCIALTYDEKLAKNGTVQLNVYPTHFQTGGQVASEPTAVQLQHIFSDIETVTHNDHKYSFWADVDNYGISTRGKQALFFDESVAASDGGGFSEVTLDEGLATIGDLLPTGE